MDNQPGNEQGMFTPEQARAILCHAYHGFNSDREEELLTQLNDPHQIARAFNALRNEELLTQLIDPAQIAGAFNALAKQKLDALKLEVRREARLEEFDYILKERPIDPIYWDMHHRKGLLPPPAPGQP